MSLDINTVGAETGIHTFSYDWKTLALYALGIGAKRNELEYLYEKFGPKVYPSFAVVPSYPVLTELLTLSRGPYESVVHSGQSVEVLGDIPSSGVLQTHGRIKAMYDLKKMAQVILETETRIDDTPLFRAEWQIIFRGEGGFGGPRRPKPELPKIPKREADWMVAEAISPEQALLYRLSGDYNPLHADPEFAQSVGFEAGPILHGLATFGYVCRALTQKACAGDATRIKKLSAQFKRPIWPGETIRTEGYRAEQRVVLQSFADPRAEVVAGCFAELK